MRWVDSIDLIIIGYFVILGIVLVWFIVLLILETKDFIKDKKEKKGRK